MGCVAIGRNEGERLHRCLSSVVGRVERVVYVDSGSTDGSPALARRFGCEVVELDPDTPFTAARARNEGLQRLLECCPSLEHVQFVDGDCEVVSGWLEVAAAALRNRPDLGVVCGRRREVAPCASAYNRLCDIEWNTPVGPAETCGGDAMMRVRALRQVGGFDPSLIAGEEPELCVRLRRAGWDVERIDHDMTLHDAAMTRFGQWWRRSVRAGHAFAEGAARHGASPQRFWVREALRPWVYGAVIPVLALGASLPTGGASLALLGAYPVSAARVYRGIRKRGYGRRDAALAAGFNTLGKFAELQGVLQYHLARRLGWRRRIIEYKGAA
ncbi:MAG: glycosyltransferase [Myxococcota bacterium]